MKFYVGEFYEELLSHFNFYLIRTCLTSTLNVHGRENVSNRGCRENETYFMSSTLSSASPAIFGIISLDFRGMLQVIFEFSYATVMASRTQSRLRKKIQVESP
jgi:hypothetical protein